MRRNRSDAPTSATVMAGHVRHVPAIRSERLSRPVAGTCPAMTVCIGDTDFSELSD